MNYISTDDIASHLWLTATNEYDSLCSALSNALDIKLGRFSGWRLWYHTETIFIDTKRLRTVYCPPITPIVSITSQEIFEKWENLWNYDWYIYLYKDYIKLSSSLPDRPQWLKIVANCWFFEQNAVDPLIKEFLLKYASQAIIENNKASKQSKWEQSWSQSGFKVWNFSVDFDNRVWWDTGILNEESINKYWLSLEFSTLLEKYGRAITIASV